MKRTILAGLVALLSMGAGVAEAAPAALYQLSSAPTGTALAPFTPAVSAHNGAPVGRTAKIDNASLAAVVAARNGEAVQLPLVDGTTATGTINLVQRENGWVRVGGALAGGKGSFALGVHGTEVGGFIQLGNVALAERFDSAGGQTLLREVPRGAVVCAGLPLLRAAPYGARRGPSTRAVTVPILNSRPTVVGTLYLDFDGATVTDPLWNDGNTIVAPPYDLSQAEITDIFERVKEDYWPFKLNVTTDPDRYNSAPVGRRMRVIVTSNDAAAPGAGGVAYLTSFANAGTGPFSSDIPAWVFNPSVIGISEAISHELGHTFGLNHDGREIPDIGHEEYYEGHGSGATSWCPIMGAAYYVSISQWSRGEYQYANNQEDDVATISGVANGVGYVSDEAGNSRATAGLLVSNQGAISQSGVITQASDTDFYTFSVPSGTVTLRADVASPRPNLDVRLELQNDIGEVLATADPADTLSAGLTADVGTGTYFLKVQGTGVLDPVTNGYSNYGSIGAYTLTGSVPIYTSSLTIADAATDEGNSGTHNLDFTVTLSPANTNTVTVNYLTTNGTAVAPTDYSTVSGTLTFAPGELTKKISVPIHGDIGFEKDETLAVRLSEPIEASLQDAEAIGTIVNDDSGGTHGGKILFTSNRDGNEEIYAMNADDGSDQMRLTNNAAADRNAVYSSATDRIAFSSNRAGNFDIYVMGGDGSSPLRLTTTSSTETQPAFSPDDNSIAFISDVNGEPELWIMNSNGTNRRQLTFNSSVACDPCFSPDGNSIVFSSSSSGVFQLYSIVVDTRIVTRLTTIFSQERKPHCSPDGTQIVFQSDRTGNNEIYSMSPEGLGQVQLTSNIAGNESPSFSFDGDNLVFISRRNAVDSSAGPADAEVYSMTSEGLDVQRLTFNTAEESDPVWGGGPLPSEAIAPAVVITTPAPGGGVKELSVISGTAIDNDGGVGLDHVDLYLKRNSDGKWWTGTKWGTSTPVVLATVVGSDNSWMRKDGLPHISTVDPDAHLADGVYTISVYAFDKNQNGRNATGLFTVDNGRPSAVVFVSPANGGYAASLPAITGTADDNADGSGIVRVTLSLQRVVDRKYWTGSTWGATQAVLLATALGKPNTFRKVGGLPLASSKSPASLLTNGLYVVTATAYDKAGNAGVGSASFTVDANPPSKVTIDDPPNGGGVAALPKVSGTAFDNTGGSGIVRVDLYLKRSADGKWWNGTQWDTTTPVALATTLGGDGSWARVGNLPVPDTSNLNKLLREGAYLMSAYAYDAVGNRTVVGSTFKVDTLGLVSASITNPRNGAVVHALPFVQGVAQDNSGGSGLGSVKLKLQRKADNKFWDGTGWSANGLALNALVIGNNWKVSVGLPPASLLADGSYAVVATAADKAGHPLTVSAQFVVDSTAPTLTIATPRSGAIVASLPLLAGTAADATGGSGLNRVVVFLKRRSDNKWWNGATWGSLTPIVLATAFKNGNWAKNTRLPQVGATDANARLTDGLYLCTVQASDKAGNLTALSVTFTVRQTAPRTTGATAAPAPGAAPKGTPEPTTKPQPVPASAPEPAPVSASPLILSASSVSAKDGSITLVFSGPLDAATATELARYQVRVDGYAVSPQSIALSRGATTVTLAVLAINMPPGTMSCSSALCVPLTKMYMPTLSPSAAVTVDYDLQDSAGRKLVGRAEERVG